MQQSDNINELAAALAAAQADVKPAVMNAVNPFLKNKYADLGSVWEAARPVLADNGLSVVQFPSTNERGDVVLTTQLTHTSGQWMRDSLALPATGNNLAQAMGSVITYMRRYALAAVLGIVADEDTDGNNGGENKQQPAKKQAKPKAKQPAVKAAPQQQAGNPLTYDEFKSKVMAAVSYFKAPNHVENAVKLFTRVDFGELDIDTQRTLFGQLRDYAKWRDAGNDKDAAIDLVLNPPPQ